MSLLGKDTWERLPDLYVRLNKDAMGYPPREWEQIKGEPTAAQDVFKIRSIPFYDRNLAFGDEVLTDRSPEGYYPVVMSIVSRSGFSTMRLSINEDESRDELVRHFTEDGVLLEFNNKLVALAIPRDVFDRVSEYVCAEKDRGRWDAEDGFLIIDQ